MPTMNSCGFSSGLVGQFLAMTAPDTFSFQNLTYFRSQSSAIRALNTPFTLSATRWNNVYYSVDISATVSLSGSQVGRVILQICPNSTFSSGVQDLSSYGNGNTGSLVVGLVLTQLSTACLSGEVPPGYWVRLRTESSSGTPTFTYRVGQEVLI